MICGVAETYLANIYVDNWFCKSDFLLLGPIIMQIWDPVCKGKGLGSIHFQIDDRRAHRPQVSGHFHVIVSRLLQRVRERTRVFKAYSNACSPSRVKLIYAQLQRGLLI